MKRRPSPEADRARAKCSLCCAGKDHPVGCLLRPLGLSKRAGCVMGSTASTPSEEEAALPPETKAMSCSVEELQKCLKETGGDRTKCEREIEEVGISLAHSLAPKFIDFAYAMRPACMCLGCHLSTGCHRIAVQSSRLLHFLHLVHNRQ